MILCNPSADNQQAHNPRSSNTGVASSKLSAGGVDYLRVSVWARWKEDAFNRLLLLLQMAQDRGKSVGSGEVAIEANADGDTWHVRPHGSNIGLRHKFLVRWGSCVISFSGRQVGLKCHPNVQIEMASTHLMSVGHHEKAWGEVMAMLAATGMEVERTSVSRIDLCVDFAGMGMTEFQNQIMGEQVIRRAREIDIRAKNVTEFESFTFGTKNKIRIYEKRKEVQSNPSKLGLMIQRRWGKVTDKAVRVEFQVMGDKLEKIGCGRGVGEVFANLGAITDYFTSDWFRIADRRVDREGKNQSKPGNSDLWNKVVQAFHEWIGAAQGELKPVTKSRQTKDQTLACLIGYASKWVAMNTVDQEEIDEVVTEMFDWFMTGMFDESVAIKRLTHGGKSGVLPAESVEDIPF